MNTLHLKKLAIGYAEGKSQKIIHAGIDLMLAPGQLVALLGPNGSGKSTLLRTLSGLQKPLAGAVCIGEVNINSLALAEKSKRLSLVLTERITHSELTVRDLVALGRYPHTNWMAQLQERDEQAIEEALQLCCLEELRDRSLDSLSDGERQRAMIARAIAQDTAIILLDEPTAHLDIKSRVEIMLLLRNLARNTQKTIVLATHELDLALNLADWIWLMPQKGEFIAAYPEALVLDGTLARTFNSGQIQFDNAIGGFRVQHEKTKTIDLQGEGMAYTWTYKALERLGYAIQSDSGNTVKLQVGSWQYCGKSYPSLSAFISALA